ncbi:MAG: alpha/beta hydrolase [Polyangiales bacterium]
MSALRSVFVEANGVRQHALTTEGDRGPVLLLHGYLDLARTFTRALAALEASGWKVYALDLRGHGETDRAPAGGYYHAYDYVADVDAAVDALGLARFHLVGHSMGGGVATRYAAARPERLLSLSLLEGVGPPAMPAEVAPDRTLAWLDGLKRARSRSPKRMATLDDVVTRMRVAHPTVPAEVLREVAAWSVREAEGGWEFRFDPLHQTTSPGRYDAEGFEATVARVKAPTLLVDGGGDMSQWPEFGARARRYPVARTVTLDGAGHMMHWTQPTELARTLAEFFAEREA